MTRLFLHGGGDHVDYRTATFGRFLEACAAGEGPLALVVAAADAAAAQANADDYAAIFLALGWPAGRLQPLLLSAGRPLAPAYLPDGLCGLYVCGGETPLYHELLCAEPAWAAALRERGAPYGGTSAGAMVAAATAILGGWHVERGGRPRQFVFPGAGEGLGPLTVRPGLGLVPFAVDAHAGQMGTLARLVNAVAAGLADEGWALDEDTQLELDGPGAIRVVGRGQAYHVARAGAGATVRVVAAE